MGYKAPRTFTANIQPKAIAAPADATAYYFFQANNTPGTTSNVDTFIVPMGCTLRLVCLDSVSTGLAGTNEAWEFYIRKNDSTDYLVSSVSLAAARRTWNNTNMNIPLLAGDSINFKTTTPTWATNPLATTFSGFVIFEYE